VKVLVAPDSFKGTLSSLAAAEAMRDGVIAAVPGAQVDLCPLSDGGEGFARVLGEACGGTEQIARVIGPEGTPVDARWTVLADGRAVLESAECIGIALLARQTGAAERTTYGVGELLLRAIEQGATAVVVGVGGSATTDGGAGAAQALGIAFDGAPSPITGAWLQRIERIRREGRDPRIAGSLIVVAADVDNPLVGPNGAARVYGPQKGASPEDVARLEAALERLAILAGDPGAQQGDGAAGGLAYGLRVFAGGRVVSGVGLVLDAVGFEERLAGSDLVLTGEGRLDATSARGKVVGAVARACRAGGVPAVAIVGTIAAGAPAASDLGLKEVRTLSKGAHDSDALAHARERLAALTADVVRSRRTGQ
jgi:glycerate kinase